MSMTSQIIVVMFLWAICFPLITLGLPHAPHLTFAAMRAFLAGITLLIPAIIMQRRQPRDLRTWLMLSVIGLGATTLGFFGMFHASEFVTPGVATVIANTQPLMAAVLAAIVLKEYLSARGKVGLFLAFIGIVLIALPSLFSATDDDYALGIFYILLAALGITISNVFIRLMAGRVEALSAMGWQLVIGSLFLAVIAVFTEDISAVTWNTPFVVSLFGLALPGTALAYWLWYRVLGQVELNRANAFSFLVPIFGLSIGIIFFHESVSILTSAGVILAILGIVLVNAPQRTALIK
jgi:drug/metabolite transporter (DMT)-like permease|tara:strand:- start:711 stop:1592 length:882 start_codon:yes stop_codon:yes gene_type:complete